MPVGPRRTAIVRGGPTEQREGGDKKLIGATTHGRTELLPSLSFGGVTPGQRGTFRSLEHLLSTSGGFREQRRMTQAVQKGSDSEAAGFLSRTYNKTAYNRGSGALMTTAGGPTGPYQRHPAEEDLRGLPPKRTRVTPNVTMTASLKAPLAVQSRPAGPMTRSTSGDQRKKLSVLRGSTAATTVELGPGKTGTFASAIVTGPAGPAKGRRKRNA